MLRRLSIAAVVALAFVAGATAASGQSSDDPIDPGLGIRLVEIPASRQDDPRARSYIIDHLKQTDVITRTIELANGETRPLDVELYAGPATLRDGTFTFAERGESNDLTGWISIEPSTVQVPAGERSRVVVTIAVPSSAPAGERYGVIWAETPGEPPPGGGVAVNTRVGIRMYLSVGPGAEPDTDFTLDRFQPVVSDDNVPSIVIIACNNGGRAVDLTGHVALADGPGGTSAGPFATPSPTTFAPGECGEVTVDMAAGLPKGPWKATAKLHSGDVVREATANITFPDSPGRGEVVTAERVLDSAGGRAAMLAALVLLVVVLLGLGTVGLRLRAKRREGAI
ncbi:MAG: peptidase [Acidimicrobiales bacterium]